MAAVRHLKFLKTGIVITWPVSERDSASSYQVFSHSDNNVAKKRFFDLAAVRHFEFAKFWYFIM